MRAVSTFARAMAVVFVLAVPGCRKPEPASTTSPAPAPEAAPEADPAPEPEEAPPSEEREQPISKVKANAIYAPDPPMDELAATTSAALKNPRSSTVSFCVDKSGVPVDVATSARSGDPKLDQICRKTVEAWRFSPSLLDGKAVKTCSQVEFKINFE